MRSDIGADNASNLASGTVADARISATIARYAELPSTNELVPTTGTTGHVLDQDGHRARTGPQAVEVAT